MNSIQVIWLESRVLLWYSQIILVPAKSTGRPSEKNLAAEVDQSPSSTFRRGVITVGQRARETVHLQAAGILYIQTCTNAAKSRPSLAAYIINVHLCNSNIDLYTLKPLRVVPNMEATQSWGMPSMPEHGAGTWWIVIGVRVYSGSRSSPVHSSTLQYQPANSSGAWVDDSALRPRLQSSIFSSICAGEKNHL